MRLDGSVLIPLLTLAGAIALDWLAGIAVAVKAGTFQWSKLPNQLESVVAPYFSPVAVITVVQGFANAEQSPSTPALTAAVIALAASYTPRFLSDAREKALAFMAGTTPPVSPAVTTAKA